MKHPITALIVSLFISACASSERMSFDDKDKAYVDYLAEQKVDSVKRITGFKFRSWTALTDNNLIITAVHNKHYLITTRTSCNSLYFANGIKINRSNNLALYQLGDSISPISDMPEKCFIKNIYPITKEQRQHIVDIGKTKKPNDSKE